AVRAHDAHVQADALGLTGDLRGLSVVAGDVQRLGIGRGDVGQLRGEVAVAVQERLDGHQLSARGPDAGLHALPQRDAVVVVGVQHRYALQAQRVDNVVNHLRGLLVVGDDVAELVVADLRHGR